MSVDEQGLVWLSDPWIAMIAISAVIGLFLWHHICLARESAAGPATAGIRVNPYQPGRVVRHPSSTRLVTRRTGSRADGADVPRRRIA